MRQLELLSPAKNLEQGREAINHGADALYIGPPAFGARVAAGNTLQDIEQLANYAHLFHSKIYVTVNTLLYDDEIEAAARMIHQLYNIGVDAILIQDLGLLKCDLPPIELHASTQTHNATSERVKFLERVGFRRVVLARETSLQQMREIRQATSVELEAFIQGALCVSYSGQCYMSEYLTHRSGNRGCCTQPCRSAYDLLNSQGKTLRKNEHLLSLKDFSAAQHIESMAQAGIVSFKIEGRLKDMGYVKNVTAFYRQLLDNMMEYGTTYRPSSSGHCTFYFTPDLTKTFNRGFTDYFLCQRQPMASFATQKSIGKQVGTVTEVSKDRFSTDSSETFVAGDGLCFFDQGQLQGFLLNRVEGNTLFPNKMPSLQPGTVIYRNNDFAFEKQLQGKTATRKIQVSILFSETESGFSLTLTDENNISVCERVDCDKIAAENIEKSRNQVERQLTKLGDTCFAVASFANSCSQSYFLSASTLNTLRRNACEKLEKKRIIHYKPQPTQRHDDRQAIVPKQLDYSYNVVNHLSGAFYQQHGAEEIEAGVEKTQNFENKALMTTKYCLRYELGQCLQHKNNSSVGHDYQLPLYLRNNKRLFRLEFDCQKCLMRIFATKDLS